MIDHVSLPVSDLARAAAFYDAALEPLGLVRRRDFETAVAFGPPDRDAPVFWLLVSGSAPVAQPGLGLHVSFVAADRASVDAFHARALAAGGRDAGAPGERPQYTQPFYGAFVLDLDGFKVEAVCRRAAG